MYAGILCPDLSDARLEICGKLTFWFANFKCLHVHVCVSCFRLVTEVIQLFTSSQKSRLLKRWMQFISLCFF